MSNSFVAKTVFALTAPVMRRRRLSGDWFSIFDIIVPPGSGAPRHHHASPEVFRILEGRLRIWRMTGNGPLEIDAVAGDVVRIPAGVPHAYSNPDQVPAVFAAVVDREMAEFFDAVDSIASPRAFRAASDSAAALVAAATEHGITILAA
jgi:mannose-6-phosphate isomerase-like protein (cupin superfamily)